MQIFKEITGIVLVVLVVGQKERLKMACKLLLWQCMLFARTDSEEIKARVVAGTGPRLTNKYPNVVTTQV